MTPTALFLSALLATASATPVPYYGAAYGLAPPSLSKRDESGETAWRYVGCYVESTSSRLLRGSSFRASNMTVNSCHSFCSGSRHAGLQNGDECWCGDALSPTDPGTDAGSKVDEAECGMPCAGDKAVKCGAPFRIALYESNLVPPVEWHCGPVAPGTSASSSVGVTPQLTHAGPDPVLDATPTAKPSLITLDREVLTASFSMEPLTHAGPDPVLDATATASPAPPAPTLPASGSSSDSATPGTSATVVDGVPWVSLGCVEGEARVLTSLAVLDQPNLTTEQCLAIVGQKGYAYAALGFGHECYGGNTPATYTASKACNYTCSDGKSCGGRWAVDLYKGGEGGASAGIAGTNATAAGNGTAPSAPIPAISGHVNNTLHTNTTTANMTVPVQPEVISGLTPPPASDKEHKVWAHFMVGFTYAYTAHNWDVDIAAAKAAGIDGFALNMGRDPWQPAQVRMAYDAAKRAGDFEMFLSFDMNSLQCTTAENATTLVEHVKSFASDAAQAKWDGKVLVSTFAGQQCSFGRSNETKPEELVRRQDVNATALDATANATATVSAIASASASASAAPPPPPPPPPVPDAWGVAFVEPLKAAGVEIFFVPSLFLPPTQQASYSWLDGVFAWNSAWPGAANETTSTTDSEHLSALEPKNKLYVPALSPGFFAHYGPDSYDKNWIYKSDDWLYCSRWEALIALRAKAPMLEIVTWNDFTESSYLAPYPNNASLDEHSPAWVEGMDHEPLQALTKFYSDAYKTGAYPEIEEDSLVLWSRPHPKDATARNDTVPRPKNADKADDALYAVVLAKAPAKVTIYSGKSEHSFDVPQGLSKIRIPSAPGTIGGYVERDGRKTTQYDSGGRFEYTDKPEEYNFNYYVGASSDPGQMIKSFAAVPPK